MTTSSETRSSNGAQKNKMAAGWKCFKLNLPLLPLAVLILITFQVANGFTPLYSYKDEGINILDNSNFSSFASNNPTALWIEFYNSWCGHCMRFAPIWKELARDISGWSQVVQLAVIDCAEDSNQPVCREYEVYLYPSVRFYWLDNRVIRDFNVPKPETSMAQNNSAILGYQYEGGLDSIEPLKSGLIEALEQHWNKSKSSDIPTNWPHLMPLTGIVSKSDLMTKIPMTNIPVILILEERKSLIGAELILDFSSQQVIIVRSFLDVSKPDLKFNQLIQDLFPPKERPQVTLPLLIHVDPVKHQTDILCCSGSSAAMDKDVRKTFAQIIRHKFLNGPEVLKVSNSREGFQSSISSSSNSPPNVPNETPSPVFMVDLMNALRYSIHNQIPSRKKLTSGQLSVMKDFFRTLEQFFPFDKVRDSKVLGFIKLVNQWTTTLNHYLDSEEFLAVMSKFEDQEYSLPEMQPYRTCSGSEPRFRGFPCSLWTLFHVLTMSEFLNVQNQPGFYFTDDSSAPHQVLQTMRSFITTFFGCSECSENFKKESSNLDNELPHFNSSVLWLWRTHNRVNKRLAGDTSEDPQHPKVQFPTKYQCPKCHQTNGQFNETNVLEFLIERYRPENIVRDDEKVSKHGSQNRNQDLPSSKNRNQDLPSSKNGNQDSKSSFQVAKPPEVDHRLSENVLKAPESHHGNHVQHKSSGGNDFMSMAQKLSLANYYNLLSKTDVGICIVLYMMSAGLIVCLFLFLLSKNHRRKKHLLSNSPNNNISYNKTVNINIRYFPV